MTNKEALEQLKINGSGDGKREPLTISGRAGRMANFFKALDIASKALEKQVAKKVIIEEAVNEDLIDFISEKGEVCRCPSCKDYIVVNELKYCWECGQKLDWSDEDEIRTSR